MSSLAEQIQLRRASSFKYRPNPCYSTSPQSPSLSVSSGEGKHWSFPWRLFSYARHQVQSERHVIVIVVAGFEIEIEGWNLEQVAEYVTAGTLSKIKALPSEYREPTDSKPYIYKIEVKELGRGK